jgi:type II secretory pathway component GspD/PulD (secretin)
MMRGSGFLTGLGSQRRAPPSPAPVLLAGSSHRRSRRRPIAESTQRITPNFKDADITQIAEAVSAATGKNFIIDPRVRAQVTMLSSTPMSPDAFYQAFLSILQVHGFVALPAGKRHQDRPRRERASVSLERPARPRELKLR